MDVIGGLSKLTCAGLLLEVLGCVCVCVCVCEREREICTAVLQLKV